MQCTVQCSIFVMSTFCCLSETRWEFHMLSEYTMVGISNFVEQFLSTYTMSWGCWKHPLWIPGVRPMFLKPKLHKESKNGFKTISCRRYPLMIFLKNCFSVQNNHQKNLMFCWFFNFYGNIYGLIRPVLINLIAGCSESVEILTKC